MSAPTPGAVTPGGAAIREASGARHAAILGVGGYRPRRVVDNHEIATMMDTSDEWITSRTGIRERRHAAPDESSSVLGIRAT